MYTKKKKPPPVFLGPLKSIVGARLWFLAPAAILAVVACESRVPTESWNRPQFTVASSCPECDSLTDGERQDVLDALELIDPHIIECVDANNTALAMLGAGRIGTYAQDNGTWGVWTSYGNPFRMGIWNGSSQWWPNGTFSSIGELAATLFHETLHEIDPYMSEVNIEWWTDMCVEW